MTCNCDADVGGVVYLAFVPSWCLDVDILRAILIAVPVEMDWRLAATDPTIILCSFCHDLMANQTSVSISDLRARSCISPSFRLYLGLPNGISFQPPLLLHLDVCAIFGTAHSVRCFSDLWDYVPFLLQRRRHLSSFSQRRSGLSRLFTIIKETWVPGRGWTRIFPPIRPISSDSL